MKALVLAGGFPQIALLKELKKRNIETVLADYYAEPVAKPFADKTFQVSTLDIEAISKLAKEEKVDFLITVCTDQALHTVAKVSEDLGLPCYIDYRTALNVTNKQYMKKVFAEKNISTAKHVVMSELDQAKIQCLRYPLIVKPVDCNSSKGVKKVVDFGELKVAFNDAVNFSRTNTAIIEEYISGEELSADIYVENGVAHVLAVSSLDKIADDDKFVIFRGVYTKEKTKKVKALVQKTAQQIADAFELKNSPMLIQMIYNGDNVYVLEFSARTGGGVKYLLVQKTSGFDVISAVVDLTLGNKPHVDNKQPENKFIVNEFVYCKPGTFDKLAGFEELKNNQTISDYYLFKWQGAVFDGVQNSGDRVAGFTIGADTIEELKQKHNEAVAKMKVLDTNGNDIMRHDLLTDIDL